MGAKDCEVGFPLGRRSDSLGVFWAEEMAYVKVAVTALFVALGYSASAGATTITIWPSTAVPAVPDVGADTGVELGVSFKSDVNGQITGIPGVAGGFGMFCVCCGTSTPPLTVRLLSALLNLLEWSLRRHLS